MKRDANLAARPPLPGGCREAARLALPLIVSMAAFTVMQFCDRLFLARYSSESIQAALPAGVLAFTLICLFQSLAGYAGTFVAHYHGAGNRRGCVVATVQGIWLALASAVPMLALVPLGFWLMRISGHAPAVLAQERIYFGWLMVGGWLVPLGAAIGGYFTGQSRMRLNTVANVAGSLANLLLDYLLIFGKWGCPELGIAGAAIATVMAGTIAPLAQLIVFLREPAVRALGLARAWRADWPLLRRLLRFGLPAGLHIVADLAAFTCFVLLTGRLGAVSLAASNIAFTINNLAFSPLLSMSAAASILTGQYQGRSDSATAMRAGWSTLKLAWCYMLAAGTLFVCFPGPIFALFRSPVAPYDTADLIAVGRPMMLLMAAWGLFDTVNVVLSGALRGVGDTRFVMFYMMLMGWGLWLPGEIWILMRGGGILAAWRWLALYVAILSVGFAWRWWSGRWRAIDLLARSITDH